MSRFNLKNYSLRSKLYITMSVSIICTAIIGLYLLFAMLQMNTSYSTEIVRASEVLQKADAIKSTFAALNNTVHNVAFAGTDAEMSSLSKNFDDLFLTMDAYMADYREATAAIGDNENSLAKLTALEGSLLTFKNSARGILAGGSNQGLSTLKASLDALASGSIDSAIAELYADTQQHLIGISETNSASVKSRTIFAWSLAGVVAVAFVLYIRFVIKSFLTPISKLLQTADAVSKGNLEYRTEIETQEEFGALGQAFDKMIAAFRQQADTLEAIAEGNYSGQIQARSNEDIVNMAIAAMLDNNNSMIRQIQTAAEQVTLGAGQISQGSQNLASGTTEQAASVEEFMASLEEFRRKTEENAEAAAQSLETSRRVGEQMQNGQQSMNDVQNAMHSIDESSQSIMRIIKVIDDIAFQTNILALNAAVEAARAAQHGKGFAVVAEEVRNLAGKSAAAAKETSAIIEGSRARVQEGNALVKKSNEAFNAIGTLSQQSSALTEKISEGAKEQARTIVQLNDAISQISQIVQNNSATAEQSAAAAAQMSAQSDQLNNLVSNFKLRDTQKQISHASNAGAAPAAALFPADTTARY